ncbi:MAG TPA: hypothetical protein VGW39_15475 [Chthoniobacterales bacterium]|nr:hypothetical protein [Chthoniobacterales bacterium]
MLDETEISQTHVSDILQEQQFYPRDTNDDRNFTAEFIGMVWMELERRARLLKNVGLYVVSGKRITRRCNWDECVGAAFLVLLTCGEYYLTLREIADYIWQGELFEDFCCEALRGNGWQATRTGWASHAGAEKLTRTVEAVANATDENFVNAAAVELYKHENESGCDLVSHWAYAEKWTGRPLVLVQCASGADFEQKLGTPDIDRWRGFITFSTIPIRGFCTPRAFEHREFRQHCGKVHGVLFDRFRLLEPFAGGATLSPDLSARLFDWVLPRIHALPLLR